MAPTDKEAPPDMQEMMAVYQKLGTPGVPHQKMASLAGTWTTSTIAKLPSGENSPPSPGQAEITMVLGGRYMRQDFHGEMMGYPFQGIGYTGYDNHTGQYVSTWMDSMSTAIMYFTGAAAPDDRTFTQEADYDDAVRGPMKWRSVTSLEDGDTFTFVMYVLPPGGEPDKMMEILYKRKKA
ncbi:MAG: DUF1579 domain-containing protein [Deltaproteobacteria bacterium]|nr:DUF1579 domain-containing protein [Deltaproteobacteria bacterium]